MIYLDDVICHSLDFEGMLSTLKQVLDRFRSANLKLKPSKCMLFQDKVEFLGFVVDQEGIHCDTKKIEAIKNWETPKSVTEIRSFVGFCQYYRNFVPNFSKIAAPLHELTKKGVKYHWNAACEEAFQTLKRKLMEPPVLAFPNENDTFILDCDASLEAAGGSLSQVQNGVERVIAYGSKKFSKTQRNMCTTMRELCSIIMFLSEYHYYLCAKPFVIRTDHASLTWLKNFKNAEGMLFRWLQKLDSYSYLMIHRSGAKHVNADTLSRLQPPRKCKRADCPDCTFEKEACICIACDDVSPSLICDLGSPSEKCESLSPSDNCDVKSPGQICDVKSPSENCDPGSPREFCDSLSPSEKCDFKSPRELCGRIGEVSSIT